MQLIVFCALQRMIKGRETAHGSRKIGAYVNSTVM